MAEGAEAFTVFHLSNFNFTGPIIISLFLIVAIWWAVSAKNWFLGPQVQGTPEELRAIEIALETGDVGHLQEARGRGGRAGHRAPGRALTRGSCMFCLGGAQRRLRPSGASGTMTP